MMVTCPSKTYFLSNEKAQAKALLCYDNVAVSLLLITKNYLTHKNRIQTYFSPSLSP